MNDSALIPDETLPADQQGLTIAVINDRNGKVEYCKAFECDKEIPDEVFDQFLYFGDRK